MQTKTQQILYGLQVLSWIIFVGYIIAGGYALFNIINTLLYIDMEEIRNQKLLQYSSMIFSLVMAYLYIELWHSIKNLLTKINLDNPFNNDIARSIEKIAYMLFTIWVVGFIGEYLIDISNNKINFGIDSDTQYLLIAGIVYIISQIFKRGIEIQEENKLTV